MSIFVILSIMCGIIAAISLVAWFKSKARYSQLERQFYQVESQLNNYSNADEKLEFERNMRLDVERKLAATQETVNHLNSKINDWETMKEQQVEAARASVLKAGSELSSKLLEDHKREAKANHEANEKRISEATQQLHKQFNDVFANMNALTEQVADMQVIRRALLEPTSAGQLSEITLNNIFQSSSLRENDDYQLQYVVQTKEGKSLKPDAVVFLPQNSMLLVDSKASRFFMELASAEGEVAIGLAEKQLKKSMNEHVKSLIVRDYRDAFNENSPFKTGEIGHISMLMFLPSDAALDTLNRLDKEFITNCYNKSIIPVGPSGLFNILMQSHMIISQSKQQANITHIQRAIHQLLKNVATLQEHSTGVGKGLKSAMDKYDKFAGSFNRSFLSSMRKLEESGIALPQHKQVAPLQRYHISQDTHEAEAAQEAELLDFKGN